MTLLKWGFKTNPPSSRNSKIQIKNYLHFSFFGEGSPPVRSKRPYGFLGENHLLEAVCWVGLLDSRAALPQALQWRRQCAGNILRGNRRHKNVTDILLYVRRRLPIRSRWTDLRERNRIEFSIVYLGTDFFLNFVFCTSTRSPTLIISFKYQGWDYLVCNFVFPIILSFVATILKRFLIDRGSMKLLLGEPAKSE